MEMKTRRDLERHLRSDQVCEKREKIQDGRLTAEEWEDTENQKPVDYRHKNVDEKWTLLYISLFPNDTHPPSPCKSGLWK
jgi:hypothetical protein